MRYFGACECCWRLLGFKLHEMYPSVVRLPMHLENEQVIIHTAGQEQRAANRPPTSKLLDWLYFCAAPVSRPPLPNNWRALTYMQFPSYFRHEARTGWRALVQRTMRHRPVGRLPPVSWTVANEELYYLRVMLCHATSGEVHDALGALPVSVTPNLNHLKFGHATYKDACRARGLATDDTEWLDVIAEACQVGTSTAVLRLVACIMAYNAPSNTAALVDASFASIAERSQIDEHTAQRLGVPIDDVRRVRAVMLLQEALEQSVGGQEARDAVQRLQLSDEEQRIRRELITVQTEPAALRYERQYDRQEQLSRYNENAAMVNQQPSQAEVLHAVQDALTAGNGGVFFLSAYAGCGKTFLEQTLLHWVRARGEIALAVASTGIAALLLEGGNTLHSKLKAPLSPYDPNSRLNINNQHAEARMIREATLLIWDEAAVHPEKLAQIVDMSCRDIRNNPDVPFGGLVVVWGGDFRQTLPIQERATAAQTVGMCLHQWQHWEGHVRTLHLTENQRCVQLLANCSTEAERDRVHQWKAWLERLGDGDLTSVDDDKVLLWRSQCRILAAQHDFEGALTTMYGVDAGRGEPLSFWADRAIVTPKHCAVDYINERMLTRVVGERYVLHSVDSLDLENGELDIGTDFLNRQNSSAMPPHRLELKVGCIVMLQRNLDKRNGLVNGTRLMVRQLCRGRLLRCVIVSSGTYQGNEVLIPRIRLKPRANQFHFMWSRIQFPVKLCYAMTYAHYGAPCTVCSR
jgi:hypothetical protein